MSDYQTIQLFTEQLRLAAKKQAWSQIKRLDQDISALLIKLKQRKIDFGEQQALNILQKVHHTVFKACKIESQQLKEKIALIQRNRDGATAYAAFMNKEDL